MSGYIKYFDDSGKDMVKYNEIWNEIKKTLDIAFHSQPVCDEKHIKTKVKTFNDVLSTVFQTIKFQKKVFITFVL